MHEKQKKHAQFVRLPVDIVKKIDEYKESKTISSRNEAILELIKKGLSKADWFLNSNTLVRIKFALMNKLLKMDESSLS